MVVLCFCLGAICIFDYTRQKIPNILVFLILISGLWISGAQGWREILRYLSVAGTVLIMFYPFFCIHALGAGDVKLLAVCAGNFSIQDVLPFLFFSFLFTAIFSLIPIMRERNLRDRIQYFQSYCKDVLRCGRWKPYCPAKDGRKFSGVCMAGPVLCSMLLHWGGVL